MNCKQIDVLLDGHKAGALSAAERTGVASHLEGCRRCADAWLSHEALAGEAAVVPPAGLYDRVLAAAAGGIDASAPIAARRRLPAIGVAAAAGLVALVLAGLWSADRETLEPQPEVANDSAESSGGTLFGDTPRIEPAIPGLVAGIHYERLPSPAPRAAAAGQVEVCEFFMFGCIHCYNFEALLTSWVESRSDAIDFVRVPALFSDLARLHAQAFYTAEALGELDRLVAPFYEEIHVRGNALASVAAIRELFGRHGIDGPRFDAAFSSWEVFISILRAEELNQRYRVSATPSIGVNGRYLTNASMTGSNEALLEVIAALVEAEKARMELIPRPIRVFR
jgi:thiol:disulfide interchange protein DsbA